jgi:O-antigen/teichoic acid export membrane protein
VDANYHKHYGWDAIRKSLAHFALGKTFRVISSLTIFLILARVLPLHEYAIYVSFQAVIAVVGVVTAIGVQKVMFRYLPELRSAGNNITAYRLLVGGMLIRTLVVSLLVLGIVPFAPDIARVFNFEDWSWLFPWYLLVGYLRLTALWLSQCLESFLWQEVSQYSLAIGSAVAAVLLALFALFGNLQLPNVVIAEIAGEASSLFVLAIGWFRKWRADGNRGAGTTGWWRENRLRVLRYGGWSYLLSQSAIFYGSAPNRLIAAHFLPVTDVAVLGATDQLLNLVRKFLPTRMLMSMVRPLAMARFSAQGDFRAVASISEFVYRINVTLLTLPILILAVVGPQLMSWLTNGKYGAAAYLLIGFLIVLIAEGARDLVELMVQALEKNPIFFWTNVIQSCSLLVALPLIPVLGVWSLVVANFAGTVLANSIVIIRLRRQGYIYDVNFHLMALIMLHAAVSGVIGWWIWDLSQSVVAATAAIVVTYSLSIALKPPLLDREKEALMSLVRGRLRKKNRSRDVAVTAADK